MAWLRDLQQDIGIGELEKRADKSFETELSLIDRIERERRRNNLQTERIKALSGALEGLVASLVSAGALRPDDPVGNELLALREAMKPASARAAK